MIKKSIVPIIRITGKNRDGIRVLIGTLRISHMIPVPESELELYDIESEMDFKYKNIIYDELAFIRKNQKKIQNYAEVMYKQKIRHDQSAGYVKTALDYQVLEGFCTEYMNGKNVEVTSEFDLNNMHNRYFEIGGMRFLLRVSKEAKLPGNFLLFELPESEVKNQKTAYTYTMHLVDQLPEPEGEVIVEREDLTVYRVAPVFDENAAIDEKHIVTEDSNPELEARLLGVKGQQEPYAYYRETSDHSAEIWFDRSQQVYLSVDPAFVSLFALERRMLGRDSLVLHCAYMESKGEAILFSAPSETGKTTQANLWEKYRGTRQVNGDRGLLRFGIVEKDTESGIRKNNVAKGADRVWVDGWPVCGSSEICHNERMPIRAIVMLHQAPENTVRRLSPMEAFQKIYTQITINSWSRDSVQKSADLIERLISNVSVYELGCTISEEAVEVLERAVYS